MRFRFPLAALLVAAAVALPACGDDDAGGAVRARRPIAAGCCWRPPPAPATPACSTSCCPPSSGIRVQREDARGRLRARRWSWASGATPTSCWFTRPRTRRSSWRRATAPAARPSCTTTSCSWARRTIRRRSGRRRRRPRRPHAHRRAEGAVRLARRRLGNARQGALALGDGRRRAERLVVLRDRPGDGRDADHRGPEAGLHPVGPRHVPRHGEPRQRAAGGGRRGAAQPLPRDRGRGRRGQPRLRACVLDVDHVRRHAARDRAVRQSPSTASRCSSPTPRADGRRPRGARALGAGVPDRHRDRPAPRRPARNLARAVAPPRPPRSWPPS